MVNYKDIRDINHVESILNNLGYQFDSYKKIYVNIPERILEHMGLQICEIDEFIVGTQNIEQNNLFEADIRLMKYWDYIDKKCSFLDLMKGLKRYEGEI